MSTKQIPEDDEILRVVAEYRLRRARAQREQANDRAVARCLLRDDTEYAELREDGTIMCTDYEGRVTRRLAGWRGRA